MSKKVVIKHGARGRYECATAPTFVAEGFKLTDAEMSFMRRPTGDDTRGYCLRPAPYTLHPSPYILHRESQKLHPGP